MIMNNVVYDSLQHSDSCTITMTPATMIVVNKQVDHQLVQTQIE